MMGALRVALAPAKGEKSINRFLSRFFDEPKKNNKIIKKNLTNPNRGGVQSYSILK